ncbi:BBP7 family outer membrane beta-barrel protein [Rhodopirellula halodulae]|uniref:BBP7 family outer membrane beta-barrel protein n=1 Tax=Rhodopirellula halodulae TaxID=2894198 RepID=UPI001E4E94D1|nr:BBP7 family outer membrane beta-barrel protein [Rhodopirellula sp. JC737]MCC9656971.1 BBP7 family outer membrane beta-barrel protein [Rhodopirellula sp. JC737]
MPVPQRLLFIPQHASPKNRSGLGMIGGFCLMLAWLAVGGVSAAVAQQYAVTPISSGTVDPYATAGYNTTTSANGFLAGFPSQNFPSTLFVPNVVQQDRLWLRTEYIRWWANGMETPALVTTSPDGTAQADAGVLGLPNTSVLYGGEINDESTNGIRFRGGFFITPASAFGIEGEYFRIGSNTSGFGRNGGDQILARPFFRTDTDVETAQLINYPGVVDGSLAIGAASKLDSYLINGRVALCPTCGGNCVTCRNTDRVDWLIGYRHMKLDEALTFGETLDSQLVGAPGTIVLADAFRTTNDFDGLQLGVTYQANLKRVWLESMLRVAVGNNKQTVSIRGNTFITEAGVTENYSGGLYAQRDNSGNFRRDEFTMVPEIGFTLGVHLTSCLDATVGYSLLYFPNVVRPGDQIDRDVNPDLLAPPGTVASPSRPEFRFIENDYVAHGLSFGGQLRF